MVTRKLVKQGTATLMVSLPAKWIKQQELEKGSQVEVEENNESVSEVIESSRKRYTVRYVEKKLVNNAIKQNTIDKKAQTKSSGILP